VVSKLVAWLTGAVLLLPAGLLAAAGLVHLHNGQAVNAAFPVPLMMATDVAVPARASADAARALAVADPRDGDAVLAQAEAGYHAGVPRTETLQRVRAGLSRAPASAEGWTFYAEMLQPRDPAMAVRALDQAFLLAPHDFYLAGRRARLAALLWGQLDRDGRDAALTQARLLWQEPLLHQEMLQLLAAPQGSALLTRAYAGDPDTMRAINRWVSAQRRAAKVAP
jgi:hypothetical protein